MRQGFIPKYGISVAYFFRFEKKGDYRTKKLKVFHFITKCSNIYVMVKIQIKDKGEVLMKKENRELAKQRKALERRRAARKKKIRKVVRIAVPCAVILALIILLFYYEWKDTRDSNGTDGTETIQSTQAVSTESGTDITGTETASETQTEEASLNTAVGTIVNEGDTVNIDFVGKIDGEEFSGGSTDGAGTDLTLGSGSYISGFEEQLEGQAVGDTVDVNVTFPESYSNTDLAGKDATFTVTINGVYQ